MRRKKCPSVVTVPIGSSQPCEVPEEIEKFLRALNSYPERFAHDPQVSFEQHLVNVMTLEAASARQH